MKIHLEWYSAGIPLPWALRLPVFLLLQLALFTLASPARAESEMAVYRGYRLGSEIDIRNRTTQTSGQLQTDESASLGLIFDVDLPEPGKQVELYVARQETVTDNPTPGDDRIELEIYQLQLGGLYFPGRQTTGGFVSGVAGITLLDPQPGELASHTRASIALGGGYKMALTPQLILRFDLRGIYTVLNSGGAVFCSGGCAVRFESNGFFQAEAGVGLAFRF